MNTEKLYERIYCCEKMYANSATSCRHHPEGCPDNLLKYEVEATSEEREIQAGILMKDNSSYISIKFCPFCGLELASLAGPVIGYHLK